MGCSSSSSSGTGNSIEEVKTQEQVSHQKNGVDNNPTEAVDRSQSVQASPLKTTNNYQTIPHKQTTCNDKEKPSAKSDNFKLDFDEFKDIDEHARQAPRSAEESIETLAKYLAKPAKDDTEVVRALYVWVCENIRYDTDAYFGGTLSSLATKGGDVLKSKTSVCSGYANVFESLCQALGITCKNISGYSKGYSHKPGDTITYNQKTNHAWNVVQLNGVWRFIETTWGAGHVTKEKKFVKNFSNFFFLTPPESFIYDHFPYLNNNIEDSKKWQLLETPISIEEYSRRLKPFKKAREYGVKFTSHPYETIIVNNSPCTIIVETTGYPFQNCWYNLNDDKGTAINAGAIMVCENNKSCKTTLRPPQKGKYTLALHAAINDTNISIAKYIIDCFAVEPNWKPFPNNTGYYGPKPDFIDRAFERSCINPFYECKNGKLDLLLKTISTPDVLVQLHDAENVDQKDYLIVEKNDSSINIKLRLLNTGYYKLQLFSKVDQSYTLAYTVLILNIAESNVKSKFPITYLSTINYKCQLIQPLVRELPANSEICFEFTSPAFESILVNKKKILQDSKEKWKVTVHTGESGELRLSGKPADTDDNSYKTIYTFVIKP
ncbi:kyphoscoliosis peptidase-like [Mytilus trossulus]|uniref:kyphoscoliosis peptidase-like n=1 Tax=Mytilus trossulus TaxID=6551 RepID=UPI0030056F52